MGAAVRLNVYDLTPQNGYTYWCGVGVFHTGVEVYSVEYAYGGHEYDVSGVFCTAPLEAPGAVLYRESVYMGETDLTPAQVQALVQQMGQQYRGNAYHLLQSNCNHFASDLCMQLVGRPAPTWINRLAGFAVMLHCLLPPTWVPPLVTPGVSPDDEDDPRVAVSGRTSYPRLMQKEGSRQQLLPGVQAGAPASDSFFEPPRPITTLGGRQ
ncbi:MAG: PPPDE putative peptidase domain-containing protein [Monoraphidium minutum]|nr:MAG: PPPDE putative peptidase domain-containing protein [Monoraphidium minutum]